MGRYSILVCICSKHRAQSNALQALQKRGRANCGSESHLQTIPTPLNTLNEMYRGTSIRDQSKVIKQVQNTKDADKEPAQHRFLRHDIYQPSS